LPGPLALPGGGDGESGRGRSRRELVAEGSDASEDGGEVARGRLGAGRDAVEHAARGTLAATADRHVGVRRTQVDPDRGGAGGAMLHGPSLWSPTERFLPALRVFSWSHGDDCGSYRFVPERGREVTAEFIA